MQIIEVLTNTTGMKILDFNKIPKFHLHIQFGEALGGDSAVRDIFNLGNSQLEFRIIIFEQKA